MTVGMTVKYQQENVRKLQISGSRFLGHAGEHAAAKSRKPLESRQKNQLFTEANLLPVTQRLSREINMTNKAMRRNCLPARRKRIFQIRGLDAAI